LNNEVRSGCGAEEPATLVFKRTKGECLEVVDVAYPEGRLDGPQGIQATAGEHRAIGVEIAARAQALGRLSCSDRIRGPYEDALDVKRGEHRLDGFEDARDAGNHGGGSGGAGESQARNWHP